MMAVAKTANPAAPGITTRPTLMPPRVATTAARVPRPRCSRSRNLIIDHGGMRPWVGKKKAHRQTHPPTEKTKLAGVRKHCHRPDSWA